MVGLWTGNVGEDGCNLSDWLFEWGRAWFRPIYRLSVACIVMCLVSYTDSAVIYWVHVWFTVPNDLHQLCSFLDAYVLSCLDAYVLSSCLLSSTNSIYWTSEIQNPQFTRLIMSRIKIIYKFYIIFTPN